MANVSDIILAFFFPPFVFLSCPPEECCILALMCVLFRAHRDAPGSLPCSVWVKEMQRKHPSKSDLLIVPKSERKICWEITVWTRKEYKRGHWHLKFPQLNNIATKSFYRSLAHHNPFKSKCCPATGNKGIYPDHWLLCIHQCGLMEAE